MNDLSPIPQGSPAPESASRAVAALPREVRVVTDAVPMLDTGKYEHMQRIAVVMAKSGMMPDTLRKDGDSDVAPETVVARCFMIVNQAVRWHMDPFAVAQCCSIVHGKLMYEGKLVAAVLDANLGVRLRYEFFDEGKGQSLGVKVSARIPGEAFDREISGRVKDWHKGPKSPWQNESAWPRQLRYMGAREWGRAHAPAIMLGVISEDEADEVISAPRNITPKSPALEIPDDAPEKPPAKVAKKLAKSTKAEEAQEFPDYLPNPDAFVRALEDQIALCESEDELQEIREGNLDTINDRLPDEFKRRALKMLSEAAQ